MNSFRQQFKLYLRNAFGRNAALFVVAWFCVSAAHFVVADDAGNQSDKTPPARLSVEQEERALEFAKEHHPELAELLQQLRKRSRSGFAGGIREIHQSLTRLERIRERQPVRYEFELKNWKLDSEIRLLTARWSMSQDPELEARIRELLRERQQVRMDKLKSERDRLAERLSQLDAQIGMGTAELEADLATEWDRLAKRATTRARAQKSVRKTRTSKDKQ